MALMYFVAASKDLFETLVECGCKNILISYFYMPKVGDIDWIYDQVENLFIDSGAHSAYTLGKEINIDDYYDYLIENKGAFTTAAHFDVVDDLEPTVNNLAHAMSRGMDWIMPVLQKNWAVCLNKFNKLGEFDYFGLGGRYMTKVVGYDLFGAVSKLPRNKKYHGFAKVNLDMLKHKYMYSVDSSSWVVGARYGIAGALEKDNDHVGLAFNRIDNQRLELIRLYYLHKDDCDACNINLELLKQGNNDQLSKAYIALYYRPKLRKLGLFDENFYS